MTTDNFAEAARAEAEALFLNSTEVPSPQDIGEHIAKWARTHIAAQEPTDGERAVLELHSRIGIYEHEDACLNPSDEHREAHHIEDLDDAGEYFCDQMPVGAVCDTCRDEDGERLDWPCPTIQALDSARAARRDEEKR